MEKKISFEIKAMIYFMLFYGLWMILAGRIIYFPRYPESFLKIALWRSAGLPPVTLIAGLVYLLASFGMLRLKHWSRRLAICLSAVLIFLMVLILLGVLITIIKRAIEGAGDVEIDFMLRKILPYLPAVLFFIFFTRPKIKNQF